MSIQDDSLSPARLGSAHEAIMDQAGAVDEIGIRWEGRDVQSNVRVVRPQRGLEIKYVWVENQKK